MASDLPPFPAEEAYRELERRQGEKTLRDEFAMVAMGPLIATATAVGQTLSWELLAEASYNVADAMMARRKRGHHG